MRWLLWSLLLTLAACVPVTSSDSSVTLNEFQVEVAERLARGVLTLQVVNEGEFGHTLVVSTVHGAVVGSTAVIPPGANTSLQVDLAPGEYQFTCRIVVQTPDGSIVDHYAEGMAAAVLVPQT